MIYKQLIPLYFPKPNIFSHSNNKGSKTENTTVRQGDRKVKEAEDHSGQNCTLYDTLKTSSRSLSSASSSARDASRARSTHKENNAIEDPNVDTAVIAAGASLTSLLPSPDQGSKSFRRSASEESLEKRKAKEAGLEEATPNKRLGGSHRNSAVDNDDNGASTWTVVEAKGAASNGGKAHLENGDDTAAVQPGKTRKQVTMPNTIPGQEDTTTAANK